MPLLCTSEVASEDNAKFDLELFPGGLEIAMITPWLSV